MAAPWLKSLPAFNLYYYDKYSDPRKAQVYSDEAQVYADDKLASYAVWSEPYQTRLNEAHKAVYGKDPKNADRKAEISPWERARTKYKGFLNDSPVWGTLGTMAVLAGTGYVAGSMFEDDDEDEEGGKGNKASWVTPALMVGGLALGAYVTQDAWMPYWNTFKQLNKSNNGDWIQSVKDMSSMAKHRTAIEYLGKLNGNVDQLASLDPSNKEQKELIDSLNELIDDEDTMAILGKTDNGSKFKDILAKPDILKQLLGGGEVTPEKRATTAALVRSSNNPDLFKEELYKNIPGLEKAVKAKNYAAIMKALNDSNDYGQRLLNTWQALPESRQNEILGKIPVEDQIAMKAMLGVYGANRNNQTTAAQPNAGSNSAQANATANQPATNPYQPQLDLLHLGADMEKIKNGDYSINIEDPEVVRRWTNAYKVIPDSYSGKQNLKVFTGNSAPAYAARGIVNSHKQDLLKLKGMSENYAKARDKQNSGFFKGFTNRLKKWRTGSAMLDASDPIVDRFHSYPIGTQLSLLEDEGELGTNLRKLKDHGKIKTPEQQGYSLSDVPEDKWDKVTQANRGYVYKPESRLERFAKSVYNIGSN